ncbi:phage tail assembly protein T [Streptomyces virginiae]
MRELLATHSSAELTEWIAYEQITGPIGPARDDILMAILAATVSNANRGKGRKARVLDFLPKWDRTKKRMAWQDMLTAVKSINRTMGGNDLTQGGEHAGPLGTPGQARYRQPGADRRR